MFGDGPLLRQMSTLSNRLAMMQKICFIIKDMEIMQLIQLHSFHHGEKDAADSTAFFFFILGGPPGAARNEKYSLDVLKLVCETQHQP